MNKAFSVISREIREIIPATIFFFCVFHLLIFMKDLLLEGYGITPTAAVVATIGALIVAKAILIADKLPIVNLFPDHALIFSVIWRTIVYLLIVTVFRYVEELIPLHSKHGDWASANRHLIEDMSWPQFWAIQICLTALLFIYCALQELIRAFGAENIKATFFSRRRRSDST